MPPRPRQHNESTGLGTMRRAVRAALGDVRLVFASHATTIAIRTVRYSPMVALLISILALIGFAISAYFTAVLYGAVASDARWIPAVCRMSEQTCRAVVFDPAARLFGLPNSVLGLAYYLALIVGAAAGWLQGGAGPPASAVRVAYLAVAVGTVLVGAYLGYVLLRVLRAPCPLCFTSHAINVAIMLALPWA